MPATLTPELASASGTVSLLRSYGSLRCRLHELYRAGPCPAKLDSSSSAKYRLPSRGNPVIGLYFLMIKATAPGGTTNDVLLVNNTSWCPVGCSIGPQVCDTDLSGLVTPATCHAVPKLPCACRHLVRASPYRLMGELLAPTKLAPLGLPVGSTPAGRSPGPKQLRHAPLSNAALTRTTSSALSTAHSAFS